MPSPAINPSATPLEVYFALYSWLGAPQGAAAPLTFSELGPIPPSPERLLPLVRTPESRLRNHRSTALHNRKNTWLRS